jgi:hypothetical protein
MSRFRKSDKGAAEGLGLAGNVDRARAAAVRAYAQITGLQLNGDVEEELVAETIELLEALRLLAKDDLGRRGMSVDFSPDP